MITVLPVKDSDKLAALYADCGEELLPTSMAVIARDGETVLGHCLFDLNDARIAIGTISPTDDLMLADGILRSALHVALGRMIIVAEYTDRAPLELLQKLDFVKNDENHGLKIEKLFASCQSCAKVQE